MSEDTGYSTADKLRQILSGASADPAIREALIELGHAADIARQQDQARMESIERAQRDDHAALVGLQRSHDAVMSGVGTPCRHLIAVSQVQGNMRLVWGAIAGLYTGLLAQVTIAYYLFRNLVHHLSK